jgi:catechol 2,3-dioxygenase-like lactoylglutathione lyase family enzyme
MTFFAWPGAPRGRVGPPQVTTVAFAVPTAAYDYWAGRLQEHQVKGLAREERLGERVLGFADPDGIRLEIVATESAGGAVPAAGPIPAASALRGFHGVTLTEEGYELSAHLLTGLMGFQAEGSEGNRYRYRAAAGGYASTVDLLCAPDARRGGMGAGVVHHIAFRTPGDSEQADWHNKLTRLDYNVSPVMNRVYFHSIYFREPGGVLFEIATDPPGFTVDEAPAQLGSQLRLPPWLEPHRSELERVLPRLRLPEWHKLARAA